MEETALRQAAEAIRRGRGFIIACHERPDGDTLGSALALAGALRKLGKTVAVVSVDGVPETYAFLPNSDGVVTGTDERGFDAAIVPDCDGLGRVGGALDAVRSAKTLISLDHHGSNPPFGDVQLYDTTSASTGEIVMELLAELGVDLDRDIAVCLMTAVVSDTGGFRFPNVTPKTFTNAARLQEAGASPSEIAQLVYDTKSFAGTKLLGVALRSLIEERGGELVWGRLTREDFRNTGASDSETEGIINHIRAVKGAKVALFFREVEGGEIAVSFRSRDSIDVSKVAQVFGGGGHAAAAGCTVKAPLREAERRVIEETLKWMAS